MDSSIYIDVYTLWYVTAIIGIKYIEKKIGLPLEIGFKIALKNWKLVKILIMTNESNLYKNLFTSK